MKIRIGYNRIHLSIYTDILMGSVIPAILWKVLANSLNPWYILALSVAVAVLYLVFDHRKNQRVGYFCIFLLGIFVATKSLHTLLSPPVQRAWGDIYFYFALTVFLLVTILVKRPFCKYLYIDSMTNQYPYQTILALFKRRKDLIRYSSILTAFTAILPFTAAIIRLCKLLNNGRHAEALDIFIKLFPWVSIIPAGAASLFCLGRIHKTLNEKPVEQE